MSTPDEKDEDVLPDDPQQLIGFMSNEQWDALLAQVSMQISEMESLPYPEVKEKVFALLAGVDTIHREGLHRLVRLFKEGVLEQVITDPAIHSLMELYDLLPAGGNEIQTEKENEINFPNIPIRVVPKKSAEQNAAKQKYPHWVPVLQQRDDLAPGHVVEQHIDEYRILLCRVEDEFFAIESACTQDGSSLVNASMNRYTLNCPNHIGCYYDVRQGARIAGSTQLMCFPIQLGDDGSLSLGIDMEFKPNLPTF